MTTKMNERKQRLERYVRWVLLVILMAFVVVTLFMCSGAHAEYETSLTEDRTLVIKKVVSVRYVPKVPQGLSVQDAGLLVTGKKQQATIEDAIGKTTHSFGFFPLNKKDAKLLVLGIKQEIEYTDKVVTYDHAKKIPWIVKPAPKRSVESGDAFLSLLFIWVIPLLIMIMSIVYWWCDVPYKKFLVSYAAIFSGVFTGTLTSWFMFYGVGMIISAATVILLCQTTDWFVTSKSSMGENGGETASVVVAVLAGIFAGGFAGNQNLTIVWQYCLFLLAIEIMSFFSAALFWFAERKVRLGSE